MNAPPILRTGRTILSTSRLNSHQPASLLLRLPPTYRAFHASPKPRLIHTLLSSTHDLFTGLHTITHLPWALTLPLSALLIRLSITLPLTLYTRRAQQRQLDLQPLLLSWGHQFRHENMAKSGHLGPARVERDVKRDIRLKRRELYSRWKCQNWKNFIPVVQLPIWFMMVETVRAMAGTHKGLLGLIFSNDNATQAPTDPPPAPATSELSNATSGAEIAQDSLAEGIASATTTSTAITIEPSLATEGALWFPDLTAADPMLILPFALSASMLLNVYMIPHRGAPALEMTPGRRRITRILGLIALAVGPLTLQMPSAILLYWLSSSLMGYGQAVLLDRFMPLRLPPKPCRPKVKGPMNMNVNIEGK
jgi:mitochondrial inner membrane protein COX18